MNKLLILSILANIVLTTLLVMKQSGMTIIPLHKKKAKPQPWTDETWGNLIHGEPKEYL